MFRKTNKRQLRTQDIRRLFRESTEELSSPRARIRSAAMRFDDLRRRLAGRDTRDPLVAEVFREFAACITRELPALTCLPALRRLTDSRDECEDACASGIASIWRYILRNHRTGEEVLFTTCAWSYIGRAIVNEARDMLRAKIDKRDNELSLEAGATLQAATETGAGNLSDLFFYCRLAIAGERRERNKEIIVMRLMQLWLSGEGYACRLEEVRNALIKQGIEIRPHALRQQANRLVYKLQTRMENEKAIPASMEAGL